MNKSIIHLSLNREKKIMGVDSNILTFEIILVSIIVILHLFYFLIILFFLHLIFKWLMITDGQIIRAIRIYSNESDYWDPWINTFSVKNKNALNRVLLK